MTTSRRNFLKTAGFLGGTSAVLGILPKSLAATPSRKNLPYYLPGAPFTADLRQGSGESFSLQGKVFGPDGKTPLANAIVEVWHCNGQGEFDLSKRFLYRGKTVTTKQGQYRIQSHFPGCYKEDGYAKMSRVFLLVSSEGYKESFSQLYFNNRRHPFIDGRQWAASPLGQRPSLPKRYDTSGGSIVVFDHFLQAGSFFHLASPAEIGARHLRLYPAGRQAMLSFGAIDAGAVVVTLINKQGQLMQVRRFRHVAPESQLVIGHEQLPSGVYTCHVSSSRFGKVSRKFHLA